MNAEQLNAGIECVARALEVVGVVVIAMAFLHAMVRAALHVGQ